MKLDSFLEKLDGGLTLAELRLHALNVLRETGIPDWEVAFFTPSGPASDDMTLAEWRPEGTIIANIKGEGGVLEDA